MTPEFDNTTKPPKGKDVRSFNVGKSDYAKHKIQPWDIWKEYNLNPWDADIIKRVLRTKDGEDRRTEYEKIIHVCSERIRQIDAEKKETIDTFPSYGVMSTSYLGETITIHYSRVGEDVSLKSVKVNATQEELVKCLTPEEQAEMKAIIINHTI